MNGPFDLTPASNNESLFWYLQLTAAEFVNLHELVVLAKMSRSTVALTTSSNEFIQAPKIVNMASDNSQSSFSI